ncbi:MAG: archaeosortase/exosortase family protein [Candidatus Diapherotrites archaeon]|nr:archaeosortase/exosortase family protein [Candidatus Diapherotrites archaeon]
MPKKKRNVVKRSRAKTKRKKVTKRSVKKLSAFEVLKRNLQGKKISKADSDRFNTLMFDVLRYALAMLFVSAIIIGVTEFRVDQRPLNNAVLLNAKLYLTALGYDSSHIWFGPYTGKDPVLVIPCASNGNYKGCISETCMFDAVITNECNGYIGYLTLLGFILAYPRIRWRDRFVGLSMGLVSVYWANVLRLTSISMVMRDVGCNMFDLWHLTIWREGMILWVLAFWVLWMQSLQKKKR